MAFVAFFHHLLARRIHALPSFSHSCLPQCFSALAHPHSHSPNLFADFAATKFNLSAADIARIFKFVPSLQKRETLESVELFVDTLSRHGFTHSQIAKIMVMQPSVMKISPKRVLEPKLQFLRDSGIQGEGLVSMLMCRPNILSLSLENRLKPIMLFLKNVFQTKDLLIKGLLRSPMILARNLETVLKPSVAFWEGFGLSRKDLVSVFTSQPGLLQFSSLTPDKVELISKIGVARDSKMFKYVLMIVVRSRMETLERKIDALQQCGLTSEETMEVFRVAANVFGRSKEKIRQSMDFIVNNMELPANSVVKHSRFLLCNLDKALKPRFLVWQKLKSMGVGIKINSFSTVLIMNEERFLRKIVKEHPQSAILYEIYQQALADASSTTQNSTKI